MRFISFKFLNPPVIAPVEYSYQADGENAVGDVVRVRCEEYPVPDLADAVKRLSLPVMSKMFGPDVAAAKHPFHFALYGLELRPAGAPARTEQNGTDAWRLPRPDRTSYS